MAYAKGKQAYGICDISGFRYKLKDMKRTWDGLLVGPDQWNEKHPQLEPRKHTVDPEALFNPRPDQAEDGIRDVLGSRGLGDVYKRQNMASSRKLYRYFGI